MGKKNISPEKVKDMIRSILPSTARVRARLAKAAESREVRRRVRMTLHKDDAEETKADLHEEAFQSPNVWSRRGADKLNHFMRWCESWTRGMTDQQALDAVRAVLPRNLIGDHAYFHWEARVKNRRRRKMRHVQSRQRLEQSRYDKTRHRLRQALSVDPGFQRDLNAAIKARKPEGEPRRMFHGVHDIDAFVRDAHDLAAFDCEWRVLLDLLHEAEQHRPHFFATPAFCLIAPIGISVSLCLCGEPFPGSTRPQSPSRNRHAGCDVTPPMKPDETPETPVPDAPFEFGDRTILALRAQPFTIEHEYGTMMLSPGAAPAISRETTEIPLPALPPVENASPEVEIDPIVRLEQKLDAALRLIQSLQQQLDSIDATLARALNR